METDGPTRTNTAMTGLGASPADTPPGKSDMPKSLSQRLDLLLSLPDNWDSYGAAPINPNTISRVEAALREIFMVVGESAPLPFIAPANDGTIVLEWKTAEGRELTLDIPPDDGPMSFLLITPESPEPETEGVVGEGWTLTEVIKRLSVG
jgi:hypothetical protein